MITKIINRWPSKQTSKQTSWDIISQISRIGFCTEPGEKLTEKRGRDIREWLWGRLWLKISLGLLHISLRNLQDKKNTVFREVWTSRQTQGQTLVVWNEVSPAAWVKQKKATATLDASWLRRSFGKVNEMTREMQGLILGQEQSGLTYLFNNSKRHWAGVF